MTIAIADVKTYTGTANTSHVIGSWGFTPTAGDLLVLAIQAGATFSPAAGWTERLSPPVANVQVSMWDQVWTTGSSVTVNLGASAPLTASLMHVTGQTPSSPFDVKGDTSGANADPVATLSGSTAQNDELIIATFGNSVSPYTTPAPTNSFSIVSPGGIGDPTTNYQVTVSRVVTSTATFSTSVHSDSSVTHSQGIVAYKAQSGFATKVNIAASAAQKNVVHFR